MDNRIYLLKQIEDCDWDCAEGFVVRARSPEQARQLASSRCGDEGVITWLDSDRSTCELLTSDGPQTVILRDYRHA